MPNPTLQNTVCVLCLLALETAVDRILQCCQANTDIDLLSRC